MLQKFGASLDEKNIGKWVLDYFQNDFGFSFEKNSCFVVDAIRIIEQVKHFRQAYSFSVCHLHVTASKEILKTRFLEREEIRYLAKEAALAKYEEAKKDPTENQVHTLASEADLVINTELSTE